jgi:hypothetical protein
LRFDFSAINASLDLAKANQNLIVSLNSSFKKFYVTYATYLGEDVTSLCENIDRDQPNISLENCARLVQCALSRDEQLADVRGIYLLIDEYDAFTNHYLEPPNAAEPHKTTWENTEVERTFTSFWSMVKILCSQDIRKVFITGISPLSLSSFGSAFNVARNMSFHQRLAGLCGLTSSDLKDVLKETCEDSETDKHNEINKHLSEMTKSFNGYHFCRYRTVETVYNTETCLAYLQSMVDGGEPEAEDPENSEVSELFLEKFATSAPLITDLEKALQCDEKGDFVPLKYDQLKFRFTLRDLVCQYLGLRPPRLR